VTDAIIVRVDLPAEIPASVQGPALLALERTLRAATGLDVRVYKDKMADDLERRRRTIALSPVEVP
jgi:hypothetical protein